jgi:hypothetical protein
MLRFKKKLRYYIHKKNCFLKRFKQCYFHNQFWAEYCKLVKTASKSNRLAWLKPSDGDLKTQPTTFWKYVSTFLKNNSTLIQLCFDGTYIDDPDEIAELLVLLLNTFTQPYHI